MKRGKNGTTQAKENIEGNEKTGKNIRKKEITASIDLQNIEAIMKTMIEVISGIEGKRTENGKKFEIAICSKISSNKAKTLKVFVTNNLNIILKIVISG